MGNNLLLIFRRLTKIAWNEKYRQPAGKHRRAVPMIGKTDGFFVTFFTRWQAHGRK